MIATRLGPLVLAWICATPLLGSDGPLVVIRSGENSTGPNPVVVEAPAGVEVGDYLLVGEGNGEILPANVYEVDGTRRLAILVDRLEPKLVRTFRLTPDIPDERPEGPIVPIRLIPGNGGSVAVSAGRGEFTTLIQGERKPYFFPVVGPSGTYLTRAYPMLEVEGEDRDHPHQRSFWISHGDVNGVDFWASDPMNPTVRRPGTIRQLDGATLQGGIAAGLLQTHDSWLDPEGVSLCEDERTFLFWAAEGYRFIDAEIIIRAGEKLVTFGDTKEGTFGLRVASALDADRPDGGAIVNAEGLKDADAWGRPSPWVDYSGPFVGRYSGPLAERREGVAIFEHPESFRHPTPWHVRGYGLFAANPFGNHDFGIEGPGAHTIEPGESIRLRYRVVLHRGDADRANVKGLYRAYANPPIIEFPDR